MPHEIRNRLQANYSAIYVTIVSVMLGLALDDIVSIMRNIESISLFNWLTAAFSVHVIFNAWVAYFLAASIVRLVPGVWDALNVFVLSVAHFGLASAIGAEPIVFFYTAACYSAAAGGVTFYNIWRIDQDKAVCAELRTFRTVLGLNVAGAVLFLIAAILVHTMRLNETARNSIVAPGLPFAASWWFAFLKAWQASGLPVSQRSEVSTSNRVEHDAD